MFVALKIPGVKTSNLDEALEYQVWIFVGVNKTLVVDQNIVKTMYDV